MEIQQKLINFISDNNFNLYIALILFHYIGDFILQTDYLAKAKNPTYWKDLKKKMSTEDMAHYIPILENQDWFFVMIAHCFIWSFCVHYPIILISSKSPIIIAFSICFHTGLHFAIDSYKIIGKGISMKGDQIFHLLQLLMLIFLQ